MIKRILIANRGEIACRIARTCHRLGIDAVAVYSEADQYSRHVREIGHAIAIGGAAAAESYLNIDKVIDAAKSSGCDAIHPGYGFLSENPDFAEAVEQAGLIFIGPRADSLRRFGDKSAAKKEAVQAQVPVIPGSEGKLTDPKAIAELVNTMTPPVMLKAAAGGGGKGMRVLNDFSNLDADIAAAMSESLRSFSDDALLVEQCINNARHVEVQIAGDGEGDVIHLFERECSLQRRHQKVVEEAPAIFLSAQLREKLLADACRLGKQIQFRGLGTVEFLVLGDAYYFLEVNPRLQVEHPVTEIITGLDLVELQIRIAQGQGFGLKQEQVQANGHAVEVRFYAESPAQNFMPVTGTVDFVQFPTQHLRVESGIDSGDEVSSYYDPMIAKLIASGSDRLQALERLQKGLADTVVFGLDNNLNFLQQLLRDPDVLADQIDTATLDRWLSNYSETTEASQSKKQAAMAAAVWLSQFRQTESKNPWLRADSFSSWALRSPEDRPVYSFNLLQGEQQWAVALMAVDKNNRLSIMIDEQQFDLRLQAQSGLSYLAEFDEGRLPVTAQAGQDIVHTHSLGQQNTYQVLQVVSDKQGDSESANSVTAPMMGEIISVLVNEGDTVEAGQLLIVMESMKMQLQIEAVNAGTVASILCKAGDNVARGAVVVEVDADA
ncbi:MAG: biotin/lipoyl-binding protein [Cycloclasticus sp.]|nr:biotin/lipoyl-binding protein [Cycloclasticus sp.]MBQ0790372.1 biotin/lipoyl-binding protein [Cycloclasticus sp.]